MRGTVAKRLRRIAEKETVGWPLRAWMRGMPDRLAKRCTRYVYLQAKKMFYRVEK